jgi:hypothetical protein
VIPGIPTLHGRVAAVSLKVAARYGFALGGGCAWVAHRVVYRQTEDVDLFTDTEGGVRSATSVVLTALHDAGLTAWVEDDGDDLFDGMDDAFVEIVARDGDEEVRLSLAQMPRTHLPVVMSVGPVMHLDDLVGSKVCALATRGEIRDYVDVAAALGRYQRAEVVALAHEKDPSLSDEDFSAAVRRLDKVPDEPFLRYGMSVAGVARLRSTFGDWPR